MGIMIIKIVIQSALGYQPIICYWNHLLGTLIKHRSYDNNSIKRMVQYKSHQMPYKERSLYKICCKIASCSKMNGLPTI